MEAFPAAGLALWLGILTSISPCPLAGNIAAVSFIVRNPASTRAAFLSGLFYTAGRMVTYVVLAATIIAGILSVPGASDFLQRYMNKLLGPVLIIAGMMLLELLEINILPDVSAEKLQARAGRGGLWASVVLGAVFALAFCPVSAAFFFGSLIPLSLKHGSRVLLPSIYGLGTGLPVLAFALLIVLGVGWLARAYQVLTKAERIGRLVTGYVFIGVGIYMCLRYIFGVL